MNNLFNYIIFENILEFVINMMFPGDMSLYRSNSALSRDSGPMPGKRVSTSSVPHPLARPINR